MSHLTFIQRMHSALDEAGLDPHSWEIRSFPTLASTSTRVADMLGLYNKVIIFSQMQSQGRGRNQNVWHSPKGGMWMSLGFLAEGKPVIELSTPVIEAVHDVLSPLVDAEIKHPNDILIDGKKVCGALVEAKISGNSLDQIVVGIGINVENEIPEEISEIATKLDDHCDPPEIQKLATEVAIAVINRLEEFIPKST